MTGDATLLREQSLAILHVAAAFEGGVRDDLGVKLGNLLALAGGGELAGGERFLGGLNLDDVIALHAFLQLLIETRQAEVGDGVEETDVARVLVDVTADGLLLLVLGERAAEHVEQGLPEDCRGSVIGLVGHRAELVHLVAAFGFVDEIADGLRRGGGRLLVLGPAGENLHAGLEASIAFNLE